MNSRLPASQLFQIEFALAAIVAECCFRWQELPAQRFALSQQSADFFNFFVFFNSIVYRVRVCSLLIVTYQTPFANRPVRV